MTIAFTFPGQGAQEVGMLADFFEEYEYFASRLDQASAVVGEDLYELVTQGPPERLNQTEITQPVLLCVSVSLYELWQELGGTQPMAVGGHSLGEYTALTAAGVFEFADAIRIVNDRGKLMQEAVPEGEGKMVAVLGLELNEIHQICETVDGVVSPANINAPGQVVIAGSAVAVDQAIDKLSEAGAKRLVPLAVSVPSHCALMEPTKEGVSDLLASVPMHEPVMPVYQNVDAKPHTDLDEIRTNLLAQLSAPVRWSDIFVGMSTAGNETIVECGPGRVLSGLARRIDRSVDAKSIGTLDSFKTALAAP